MRYLPPPFYTAVASGDAIHVRDFIWLDASDRMTGALVSMGVHSDVGDLVADVIDPVTGGVQARTFYGAGASIEVSDIRFVQGITVQTVNIDLLYANGEVNDFFRTYQCKQAPISIFRGVLDPVSRVLVAPAVPRFFGRVDNAPFETGKEGDVSKIAITATSNSGELTRSNSMMRDDASQRLRSAIDNYNQDTVVVKGWQQPWGSNAGPIPT